MPGNCNHIKLVIVSNVPDLPGCLDAIHVRHAYIGQYQSVLIRRSLDYGNRILSVETSVH